MSMEEIFVARQPIFDRTQEIYGYELLYRSGSENRANVADGDQATMQVIVNAFMEIGLNSLVGRSVAFINMTRNFLLEEHGLPFSEQRVVLEVLEDVYVDDRLVSALKRLADSGYRIALDDYVFQTHLKPLLDVVDIVKVDVLTLGRDSVVRQVDKLRELPVKLLAEKVETQEDFEFYLQQGFDFFQGYFFCKPNVVKGQRVPRSRLQILQLLAALQNPEASIAQLEPLIAQDATLNFKLLRWLNSSYFGFSQRIDSIQQAMVYVGWVNLRNWVAMLSLMSISEKPHSLITVAMVRAKMCELLAKEAALSGSERFFLTGLLSVVDAILDLPLAEIVSQVPLETSVKEALVSRKGALGEALRCAVAYEEGDWDGASFASLRATSIERAYLDAIAWADQCNAIMTH